MGDKMARPSVELIERARELRQKATPAEEMLWQLLRKRQLLGRKFRRQHPMGRFIADFFCDDARLVIEIDGAVHQEPSQKARDEIRQAVIEQYGYAVLRFTNQQVLYQTESVLKEIADFVQLHSYEHPPPTPLSHSVGEGPGVRADYAEAVVSYLGLNLDTFATYNCSFARYRGDNQSIERTFDRQTVQMIWDYGEVNPIGQSRGDWENILVFGIKVLENCSKIKIESSNVNQASTTSINFEDNYFDIVCTDPPYYDNVPYSYLSDFFYVWLKRSLGNIYPDLFSTPLTPKKNEIVAYSNGPGGFEEGKKYFEDMLKKSFQEIHRVLKPNGITVIVYAHKSTEGWETLINSLLDSSLIISGAWPLNTEMQSRLRASESAALASSIYIVARKMQRQSTGFYNQVKEELNQYLAKKLERLWQEGISGSDFFIAAIGSAIEVFGKYERVMDYEGNIIRAGRLLQDVRKIVTDFAVRQILHNGFVGEISDLTRFYVLYRWNYGAAKVQFDEARKLAQSCSIDLSLEWNRGGFIKKEKEFIRVLGPQERKAEEIKHDVELIDVLHKALQLWEKSKRQDMLNLLKETGLGKSEAFYRVAQAISETLPNDNKEKKLLDGFLSGRERRREEMKKETGQTGLFD